VKIVTACALLASLAFLPMEVAAAYPDKPIHIIVPFTAGSGTDIVARTVAESMARSLKQPIVIENRPGAGGTLGATQVAKGPADGYTLLVHSAGHAANAAIYPALPYDTVTDFAGVTALASLPNVLVAAPSKGFRSVRDLVDKARARPGTLNYGSAGYGSATHMNAEIFRLSANFEALHVPYRGTPEAMTETTAGRIDFFFAPLSSALPLIKDGRLQALAVGTAERSPLLPETPTTIEAGFGRSDYIFWVALLAPAATPRPVIDRLHAEAVKALASPEVMKKLEVLGAVPMPMATQAFDGFIRTETRRMGEVIRKAGIVAQ
jgi:tripartite-type tricarboxylate transporter receptor subunit TctC